MYIEFKPGEKHAAKDADISKSHSSFQDAGWLLENDDIVIDIDHLPKESIKALLKTFDIKTQVVWTDRGAHLYFSQPTSFKKAKDGVCQLGFPVEQLTNKTRPHGVTIKRNGILRTIENEGVREPMPEIFNVPVNKKNAFDDLTGLEEHSGRNNKLFRHRVKLGDVDGYQKILRFINQYVFSEPLDDDEFLTIIRGNATVDTKDEQQTVTVAREFVKKHRVVDYANMLWYYDRTLDRYVPDVGLKFMEKLIYTDYDMDDKFTKSVLNQIKGRATFIPKDAVFPIRVKNGIIKNGKFIEIENYTEFTPYKINIRYNPAAEPVKLVDDYLANLTDGDECYRNLLMETMGYIMVNDIDKIRAWGRFFFLRGDGANGKSTLFSILRRIFGAENCTNMSIKQMTDDRYKVTLVGKLVNLGDDIEPEAINNDQMKVLKNITTADTIQTRRLYSESMEAIITTKLFFTTNSDIKSFEKGYAFKRRVKWLPMFNKVEKPDPAFVSKITTADALEYWLRLIVEGYMRLYQNGSWTECQMVEEYNNSYHEKNNLMLQFARDLGEDGIHNRTISEIKEDFLKWNTEDGAKFSSKLFKAAVWDEFKMGIGKKKSTGSGLTSRAFMKADETNQILDH